MKKLKKIPIKRDKDALELGSLWTQKPRPAPEAFQFFAIISRGLTQG